MAYKDALQKVLNREEIVVLRKLTSPQKIQDFLDTLPINFELQGETYMSPRRTLAAKTAHCFEGALLAALALAYHGHKPLLLDLRTVASDEDHVVTLFKQHGHWGAISKTNHSILRYRDPIYTTVHELALSYFHEYTLDDGRKTLREYSAPFDMSKYAPSVWVTSEQELFWLVEALDESRHFPLISKKNVKLLRKALPIEVAAQSLQEWRPDSRNVR